ncbi:MAG TPA: shikimate dehydrogenase [Bacteroidales bacterium]|nr:shikimate dehydrogenase [Bacteroidales bacterium]
MSLFGLIGFPLTHSFSADYFNEKFSEHHSEIQNVSYQMFSLSKIEQIQDLIINNQELCGLNVTHPYKKLVINYLDDISNNAKEIGAVNTIKIIRTQNKTKLIGYNTDGYGFEKMLKPLLKPHHQKALVLGSGGVSNAIQHILKKNNISFTLVTRKHLDNESINYHDLNKNIIEEHTIVINATPVGMFPNITDYPNFPYHFLSQQHLIIDLIYNPLETNFLQFSKKYGATTKNGLEMFHYQAEKSWEIWCS